MDDLEAVSVFQKVGMTMAMLGLLAEVAFGAYQVYKVIKFVFKSYVLYCLLIGCNCFLCILIYSEVYVTLGCLLFVVIYMFHIVICTAKIHELWYYENFKSEYDGHESWRCIYTV